MFEAQEGIVSNNNTNEKGVRLLFLTLFGVAALVVLVVGYHLSKSDNKKSEALLPERTLQVVSPVNAKSTATEGISGYQVEDSGGTVSYSSVSTRPTNIPVNPYFRSRKDRTNNLVQQTK